MAVGWMGCKDWMTSLLDAPVVTNLWVLQRVQRLDHQSLGSPVGSGLDWITSLGVPQRAGWGAEIGRPVLGCSSGRKGWITNLWGGQLAVGWMGRKDWMTSLWVLQWW